MRFIYFLFDAGLIIAIILLIRSVYRLGKREGDDWEGYSPSMSPSPSASPSPEAESDDIEEVIKS